MPKTLAILWLRLETFLHLENQYMYVEKKREYEQALILYAMMIIKAFLLTVSNKLMQKSLTLHV